jgi:hypothetical protein
MTREQLESPRFQRLGKLRELLDSGRLSPDLRWARDQRILPKAA